MEAPYHILSRQYFPSHTLPLPGAAPSPLDLGMEESEAREVEAGTPDGNFHYHTALLNKMAEVPFPDREALLRHHGERSGEPASWLRSLAALLTELGNESFLHDANVHETYRRMALALMQEYRKAEGASTGQRLRWKGSPESFFWVFEAMIQSGLLDADGGAEVVTSLLHKAIGVPQKGKAGAEYSPTSFRQNLKPTSNIQTGGVGHEEMRNRIEEMIRSLPR